MNALLLILIIVLAILQGVERFLNQQLAHHITDAQVIKKEKLKRSLGRIMIIMIVITVCVAIITYHNSVLTRNGQSKLLGDVNDLIVTNSSLKSEISDLIVTNSSLKSDICEQTKAISDLLLFDANKPDVDVATRAEMLRAKKQLDVGIVCIGDWGT